MKQTIETSAPAREERLHAGSAFGGTCGELRCSLNQGGTCLSAPTAPYAEWRPLTESDQDKADRDFRISRTANVFNVGSMSRDDELELQRLLNAIGLTVNFLPCYSQPGDFRTSLEAALNVSVCGTHDDYYLKYLKETFGIPYLIDTIPIGRKNIARWLRKSAEFFHLEK